MNNLSVAATKLSAEKKHILNNILRPMIANRLLNYLRETNRQSITIGEMREVLAEDPVIAHYALKVFPAPAPKDEAKPISEEENSEVGWVQVVVAAIGAISSALPFFFGKKAENSSTTINTTEIENMLKAQMVMQQQQQKQMMQILLFGGLGIFGFLIFSKLLSRRSE